LRLATLYPLYSHSASLHSSIYRGTGELSWTPDRGPEGDEVTTKKSQLLLYSCYTCRKFQLNVSDLLNVSTGCLEWSKGIVEADRIQDDGVTYKTHLGHARSYKEAQPKTKGKKLTQLNDKGELYIDI